MRVTSSPGVTVIDSETGVRFPPIGSARKRNDEAPKTYCDGILIVVVELPPATPSLTRWEPAMR